jgi:hypothetical protein
MFKRTAVPPVGPSEHQARQPLNMALGPGGKVRALWLVNPGTVAPVVVAFPLAAYQSFGVASVWFMPIFGLFVLLSAGAMIIWLPLAGPVLHRLPGKRYAVIVPVVSCVVTALVFGAVGLCLATFLTKILEGESPMVFTGRLALSGGYFGIVAAVCMFVDPSFRAGRGA